ncbi:hypothetical protein FQN50_000478 [Emmonsiellopsis sp. PD_5]|nr:hypothetical protein FQN50_000478 [Emmonsiellopsis sp. PD_5]
MSESGDIPLLERVETAPSIPKDAALDLALLEREFVAAEVESLRSSIPRLRPLYTRRNALITTKLTSTDFWPRVFASAPADIDNYILPSDAEIIGRCLKNVTVERPGVDDNGNGEPRSLRFVFEFDNSAEENVWFSDAKVVKEFWWRKSVTKGEEGSGKRSVWEGLVSEPVRISWRSKEVDPTKGLLDAACDLAEKEKEVMKSKGVESLSAEKRVELREYEKLVKEVERVEAEMQGEHEHDHEHGEECDDSPAGMSFFAWFGYRGRAISAAESEAAMKDDDEYWAEIAKGKKESKKEGEEEDDEDDDEDEDGLMDAEIFPDGDDLAVALSEDLWENALQYYVQSFDVADDFDSDIEMGMLGGDDEGSDDEDEAERPRKKAKA